MPERTGHNEAMRLADRISPETSWYEFDQVTWCNEAAALLRNQAERIAELELQPVFAQLASDLAEKLAATEAERDQLRAEVERLRADGERYVYLRDVHHSRVPHDSLIGLWVFSRPTATALAFDESIDAARTTHKETE